MNPGVGTAQVAAAVLHETNLGAPRTAQFDGCADCIVRTASIKYAHGQPVSGARRIVAVNPRATVRAGHQQVEVAVGIDVYREKSASYAGFAAKRSGIRATGVESSASVVDEDLVGFAVSRHVISHFVGFVLIAHGRFLVF